MNINDVRVGGGLVRDPELRFLPSGVALLEFTVAVNDARYDSQARSQVVTTEFVACQAWGWLAEKVAGIGLSKGDEVFVLGKLSQREFEKKDGSKERKTRVVAYLVEPTKMRQDGRSQPTTPQQPDPWQQDQQEPPFDSASDPWSNR